MEIPPFPFAQGLPPPSRSKTAGGGNFYQTEQQPPRVVHFVPERVAARI